MPTSSSDKYTFRKSGITAVAVQLTTSDLKAELGVQLFAPATNANTIFVGFSSAITTGTDASMGFPLAPGYGILVQTRNANELYCIGGPGTGVLHCMVL